VHAVTQPLALPARPLLRINVKAGDVIVRCEKRSDILVERGVHKTSDAALTDQDVTLKVRASTVEVRCPMGTNLNIGSIAGKVVVSGDAGDVRVATASGNISVERAKRVDLRSISGRLEVGGCGDCRLATKSGRVAIGSARSVDVATVSGRVALRRAAGAVKVKSVSGVVEVGGAGAEDIQVHTLSGSVTVRLPAGTRPELRLRSLTSRATNPFTAGEDCSVAVSTLSGKVELVAD